MNIENDRPRAAIVIVAYNDEAHIEQAIRSACEQTEKNIEIICVDDGSTDSTYERICQCAARDERIKPVTQANNGTFGARYSGLQRVTSEYVLFLDSDDKLMPEAVETACSIADETGADVLEFGTILVKDENNPPAKETWTFLEHYFSQEKPLPKTDHGPELVKACFVEQAITWNNWNKCRRTELLRKAFQFYQGERVGKEEDMLLNLMVLCQAKRYVRIPTKLYTYTVGSGPSTTTKKIRSAVTLKNVAAEGLTLKLAREWFNKLGCSQDEAISGMDALTTSIRNCIKNNMLYRVAEEKRGEYLELLAQYCERNEYYNLISEAISRQQEHIALLEEQSRGFNEIAEMRQARIEQLEVLNEDLAGLAEARQVRIEQLEAQNEDLAETAEARQAHITELEAQNRQLQESFSIISNSTCWKITKPVRAVLDYAKLFTRTARSKLFQIQYHIDEISIVGNRLHIRGWIFGRKYKIEMLELMLCQNGTKEIREITKRCLQRRDVEAAFQTKMGLYSGFDQLFRVKLSPTDKIRVYLLYTVKGQRKRIYVGVINFTKSRHTALLEQSGYVREQFLVSEYSSTPLPESVDIIVPVYNGYQFLEKLFAGLKKTDRKHRIIFIDDNSPDERVLPALRHFAAELENVTVMHNEKNLGFVRTVNSGLNISTKHVVILNTDVELPCAWIERLMKPIFQFENVASVTPFSNCATIFSFPEIGDNPLYRNLSVDDLDRYFRRVNPQYTFAPTGVGFCMAMSRKALDSIGLLDDVLFEKGYGEENDWCQRAIKAGFVNVHAENLFVYHKHGGSFLPEEKKLLIEEHTARLMARYPNYLADVANYTQRDPLKNLRAHLRFRIRCADAGVNNILVFSHDLGGGADMYLDAQCPKWQAGGNNILILRYVVETGSYRINCLFSEEAFALELVDREDLTYLLQDCAINHIVVNELVTYPDLFDQLSDIQHLKQEKSACLTMLVHDYFAVSPSLNLISPQDWVYTREGNRFHCDRFYDQDGWAEQYRCPSIETWRQRWEQFLLDCDEVRCFSEDSRQITLAVYPTLTSLTVVPHIVDYMPRVQKACKTTATLNIGVLGNLTQHKGRTIVYSLCKQIERENRDVKIVLIGEEGENVIPAGKRFQKTGRYKVEDIPWLVLEKDVDLFLIPSIWPETFSYTTEEVIKMGLPIVCLNLGAPAERIRSYEKGLVLSGKEPQIILKEICDFARQQGLLPTEKVDVKRFLFIAEYISYSSRYRVDHAREQLFAAGIDSDFIEASDLKKGVDLKKYQGIYLYRCRNLSPLKEFLCKAKGVLPILYDIDDYIFDYEKIKGQAFLKQKEYEGFDVYSRDIFNCMEQCDAFVTSTETLANAIREQFPKRPVFVNRNHASAAMYILSRKAVLADPGHVGTLMGYFSGSKTHDEDFAMIEGALVSLLRKYPSLRLLVVGCCRLSSAFDAFPGRVIQKGFVSWRELPALIRSVDINLMPLTDSFFNCCKSENKWTEAALVKRVTVCARNPELEASVKAEDIVFFETEQSFEMKVSRLIESKEARQAIAEKAFQTVCENKLTIRDYSAFAAFMRSFCQ